MISVTRLGDFWQVFETNFLSKVSQMCDNFGKISHLSHHYYCYFLKIRATLYFNIWSHWRWSTVLKKMFLRLRLCTSRVKSYFSDDPVFNLIINFARRVRGISNNIFFGRIHFSIFCFSLWARTNQGSILQNYFCRYWTAVRSRQDFDALF